MASSRATLYDTFDVVASPTLLNRRVSSPVSLHLYIKSKEINEQVDFCSFINPIQDVALFLQNVKTGQIGYQTATGKISDNNVTLPAKNLTISVVRAGLVKRCQVAVKSPSFGLSDELAMAQEIFQGSYLNDDIEKCYQIFKPKVVGDIPKARYKDAFRIQYMLYMVDRRSHSVDQVLPRLDDIAYTKDLIFKDWLESTENLIELT
ncbi:hypothetical protein EGW08_013802, partial [Elysia chlorotica]